MRVLVMLAVLAGPAAADGWQQVVDEDGVLSALEDRKVEYETASQVFYRSGKTLYDSGRPSWGNWRAQGAQYCSEWPPAGSWACYDLFVRDGGVRFVGAGGDVTDGRYVEWSPPE